MAKQKAFVIDDGTSTCLLDKLNDPCPVASTKNKGADQKVGKLGDKFITFLV